MEDREIITLDVLKNEFEDSKILNQDELKQNKLRMYYTNANMKALARYETINAIILWLMIFIVIALGFVFIYQSNNTTLIVSLVLSFVGLHIPFFIVDVLSIIIKRRLSVLNPALKEAWESSYKFMIFNKIAKGLSLIDDNSITGSMVVTGFDSLGKYHFCRSQGYLVDGLNYELSKLGLKNVDGLGDHIVTSLIFSMFVLPLTALAVVVYLLIALNKYPDTFLENGLSVGCFILAGGLVFTFGLHRYLLAKYLNFVSKIYKKASKLTK